MRCCRRAAVWLAVAGLVLGVRAHAGCSSVGAPPLQRIDTQLWLVAGEVQLLAAREGRRLWLVGSGPTPATGAALACALRRATGLAVSDIVHTRPAAALNLGSVAFPGARRWALPETAAALRERCPVCLQRERDRLGEAGTGLTPAAIVLPDHRIDARSRRLGPFEWRAWPRAPGEPVLVLRHRRSGLVVAQGLLWAGAPPDLRETDSAVLLASLRALRAFAAGARLVGEQGGVAGAAAVGAHIAYIEALHADIDARLQRGELPEFPAVPVEWPDARRHALNLQRVWREREDALLR